MCNMCISSEDFYEYTRNIYVACSNMSAVKRINSTKLKAK